MRKPFFSIILPTKNRSAILCDAIRSVLTQTFTEFELIISDNDDSAAATRDAVAQFNDPRIRYFRTNGNLAMHENWEFGSLQAEGQYITVLEDKIRLVSNALEIVHTYAQKGHKLITASIASIPDDVLSATCRYPNSRIWKSEEIIRRFVSFHPSAFFLLPKGIDCFANQSLIALARRQSPTGMLFSYVCPDYSFGFQILRHADELCQLRAPLFYIPQNWIWTGQYSNGFSAYKKSALIMKTIQQLPIDPNDMIRDVPVKVYCFWVNMVVYDFLTKYAKFRPEFKLNWIGYFAFVRAIIILGSKVGGEMSAEQTSYAQSLAEQSLLFRTRVCARFYANMVREAWRVVQGRYNRWSCLRNIKLRAISSDQ